MLQQPGNLLRGWILSNNDDNATLLREEIRAIYYNKQKYTVTFKIQKQSVQHFLPACLQAFLISNDLSGGSSISNRSNRIWSTVWIGAGVRFEMVSRSAEFLGFLNFIRRGFFVRTLLAAQGKFAPDHWIRQFLFQQPSMNPAHFTRWVSSADQGPNLISKPGNAVYINMDTTENSLTDTGFDELVCYM